jgi:alkylation response protein AidB-like acyl-CoA dehydrogenase
LIPAGGWRIVVERMEPDLVPRERTLVEQVEAFARQHVAPCASGWERDREPAEAAVRLAAREGLAGLLLAERHGGLGLRTVAAARAVEALAAAHLPFAFSVLVHANVVAAIGRQGSRQQVEAHLPGMLTGETVGAFCLTEPGAGSDAAALTTRATRDGAGWRVDGEKAWVTNGAFADLCCVYAQTDPALGSRGIASFLVPARAAGVIRLAAYALLGGHAMGAAGLRLADVAMSEERMLAPPGAGFRAALAGIDLARVLLAAMCCGALQASLEAAVRHARERHAFGHPIAEFQGLQWSLADVATELAAARALAYAAARAVDAGADAALAAAHAKKFATRVALAGVAACMRAMGAVALRDEYPLGRHLAAAQIAEYLDGTTGIQNVVIARRLLAASDAERRS